MNRKYKIIGLPVLALLAVLFTLIASRRNVDSAGNGELLTAVVQRGDLKVAIQTVGVVDAAKSHMISSDIRGNKGKIIYLVSDGSWVEKGEALVRLDPSPFETEVHHLQGKVKSLEAAAQAAKQLVSWEKNQVNQNIAAKEYELKVARLDIARLVKGEGPLQLSQYEEEMRKAKAEYERYSSFYNELKKLEKDGFDNPAELVRAKENAGTYREKYDAARRRFESYRDYVLPSMEEAAKAKVENSMLQLAQSKKAAVFKIANAVADAHQAEAKLETVQRFLELARTELENTVIRAPQSGIAILYEAFRDGQKRKPREGDTVLMNQPILYLPDITSLIVRTRVREVDLHKVETGQKAAVLIDAYPSIRFKAEVQFVGALATGAGAGNKTGKYFQVVLGVSGRDMRLRPGMTARVIIQAEPTVNALLLPVQAIFQDNSGRPFCYVVSTFNRIEKVPLELGRENEMRVEVVSGVQQGDRVRLIAPD